MFTLEFIIKKFNLDINKRSPIEIPNFGKVDLASLFHDLNFKRGVEVGVCEGIYTEQLCSRNPQAEIYGVDPFVAYKEYTDFKFQKTINTYHNKAAETLGRFNNFTFIKKMSMDAVHEFKNHSIDFVYIDGNHADPFVSDDIREWWKKLKRHGIFSGHDYIDIKRTRHHLNYAVKKAVNTFVKNHRIRTWFTTSLSPKHPDWSRSWIIVKP